MNRTIRIKGLFQQVHTVKVVINEGTKFEFETYYTTYDNGETWYHNINKCGESEKESDMRWVKSLKKQFKNLK